MLSSLKKNTIHKTISPDGLVYRCVFSIARLLFKMSLVRPNRSIHYIENNDWILILTPLAGSSSILSKYGEYKRHVLGGIALNCHNKKLYVMDRPYDDRVRSFYNKKVRNPTNVLKAFLLATCPPLTHTSTPEQFLEFVVEKLGSKKKDKHLYTNNEILCSFDNFGESAVYLSISEQKTVIEELLSIKLNGKVNSTEQVSVHAAPVEMPRKLGV